MFVKLKKNLTKTLRKKKTQRYVIFPFLVFISLLLIVFASYSIAYAHKYYLNQFLGGENISGKTVSQAKDLIAPKIAGFLEEPIVLNYEKEEANNKLYEIKPKDIGLQYDLDKSLNEAMKYGRGNGPFVDLWQQSISLFAQNKLDLSYVVDKEALDKKIADISSELDIPEKDYSIIYENGRFSLSDEKTTGLKIDQDKIKKTIETYISTLNKEKIIFNSKVYEPRVDRTKAEKRLTQANQILDAGNLNLNIGSQKFSVNKDTIGAIIVSVSDNDDLNIVFNEEKLKTYVLGIAKSVNVSPKNAVLKVSEGKVMVFQSAIIGKKIDQDQLRVDIKNALFSRISTDNTNVSSSTLVVKIEETKPEINDDSINSLGIIDLISSGTTDFKNSTANRVHNIQTGVTAINGTLLKPGETFSTLGHLGTIDAAGGYLPELVIKDNRTTPEYGGGLCQVSTTLFRSALNAGLEINQRQNHKYRVSYYEPPVGMDATIYDPAPDFKFTNNYESYILIQGHISGTKVTFEMYGTKDSRVVEISEPTITATTDPPSPAYAETESLAPGEKKLLEKSHQGATTNFQYKVTKDGKTILNKTFKSVYVPWQEKWLIGKTTNTDTPTEELSISPLTPDTPMPE